MEENPRDIIFMFPGNQMAPFLINEVRLDSDEIKNEDLEVTFSIYSLLSIKKHFNIKQYIMTSEEFLKYIQNHGKGDPVLERKFLDLLWKMINFSHSSDRNSQSISEYQHPNDRFDLFLN